jgi:hypothetical protein
MPGDPEKPTLSEMVRLIVTAVGIVIVVGFVILAAAITVEWPPMMADIVGPALLVVAVAAGVITMAVRWYR